MTYNKQEHSLTSQVVAKDEINRFLRFIDTRKSIQWTSITLEININQ